MWLTLMHPLVVPFLNRYFGNWYSFGSRITSLSWGGGVLLWKKVFNVVTEHLEAPSRLEADSLLSASTRFSLFLLQERLIVQRVQRDQFSSANTKLCCAADAGCYSKGREPAGVCPGPGRLPQEVRTRTRTPLRSGGGPEEASSPHLMLLSAGQESSRSPTGWTL